MKTTYTTTMVALLAAFLVSSASAAPPRLKRADSFLGIHFDFHAGKDCTEIGKNTTRAMIENIIDQVKPDYLQIDCKGHPGLSSYPTKVGNRAPGFVGDPLRLWRDVTRDRGVALYMHYSGVWDSEAISRNPAWAARNADGKPNDRATSFFSPYAEQLLIPQLRELAGDYGVDGVWVDGECWASVPDYGEASQKAFREATGIQEIPKTPGDAHWFEWLQFNREQYREYLRRYIAEVKKTNPDFQICSNWAFTDHMPEAVCAPVDFLSGDYSPEDSVNSARLSARYLARQGKPWDLMAWSFTRNKGAGGTNQKTAVQLQREAAVVLALGGGFQAYFKQKRDGSIYDERMPVMAEVAKFCRSRQAVCHRAEPVPQIALLFSTAAHYRRANGLFSRELSRISGALQALLESQQSVEVLGEHQLQGRLSDYPLVVVPEWEYLDPSFRDELLAYVSGGGDLLLIGPGSAALFAEELAIQPAGEIQAGESFSVARDGVVFEGKGEVQQVRLGEGAVAFGQLGVGTDSASASHPAASIRPLGKGRIAATYFAMGQQYLRGRSPALKSLLNALVHDLFPSPLVEVTGSSDVDVCVNRSEGRLAINLVNTSGPHDKEPIVEQITPVGPLTIRIRSEQAPKRITVEPAGTSLEFQHANGMVTVTMPQLAIHDIVLVQP